MIFAAYFHPRFCKNRAPAAAGARFLQNRLSKLRSLFEISLIPIWCRCFFEKLPKSRLGGVLGRLGGLLGRLGGLLGRLGGVLGHVGCLLEDLRPSWKMPQNARERLPGAQDTARRPQDTTKTPQSAPRTQSPKLTFVKPPEPRAPIYLLDIESETLLLIVLVKPAAAAGLVASIVTECL